MYRLGGKIYGQSNVITGPLILGHILKDTDVFVFSIMTSNALRAYELADWIHEKTAARVIIGGMHVTYLPGEALQHADQVITGEGEQVILDVLEGRITDRIVAGISYENLDEVPFPDYSILKTPCKAAKYFYDFPSAKKMWELFGAEYGRRRFWLAVFARLGAFGAQIASRVKGTSYYKLRTTACKYEVGVEENAEETSKSTCLR